MQMEIARMMKMATPTPIPSRALEGLEGEAKGVFVVVVSAGTTEEVGEVEWFDSKGDAKGEVEWFDSKEDVKGEEKEG